MAKKVTKRAIAASLLSLTLCTSMLIGTTYAWFTDSVVSDGNIIKSGTLDVEMEWADAASNPADETTDWTNVEQAEPAEDGAVFYYDKWEPGYVQARHIRITNKGTLALKYNLVIVPKGTYDAEAIDLASVIDVYFTTPAKQLTNREELTDELKIGTLRQVIDDTTLLAAATQGYLLAKTADDETYPNKSVTLALKMQEAAGNDYQDKTVQAGFDVSLFATQYTYEADTFDNQYDKDAPMETAVPDQPAEPTDEDQVFTVGNVTVTVPAGKALKTDTFTLNVNPTGEAEEFEVTGENGVYGVIYNIDFQKNGETITTGDVDYPVTIKVDTGLSVTNVYHNGTAVTPFTYDAETGIVSFTTSGFSPFEVDYRKPITITFTSQDDTLTSEDSGWITQKTQTVFTGQPATLQKVSDLGFTSGDNLFVAWRYWDEQGETQYADGDTVTFYQDTNLEAVWAQAKKITFSNRADGVSGTMSPQMVGKNVPTALNKCTLTRPGYVLNYWQVKLDYSNMTADEKMEISYDSLLRISIEGQTFGVGDTITTPYPLILIANWRKVLTLNTTRIAALSQGQQNQLTASVHASVGSAEQVVWTSSDASVASVDSNGLVTVQSTTPGAKATITATIGEYTDTCEVIVPNHTSLSVGTVLSKGDYLYLPYAQSFIVWLDGRTSSLAGKTLVFFADDGNSSFAFSWQGVGLTLGESQGKSKIKITNGDGSNDNPFIFAGID